MDVSSPNSTNLALNFLNNGEIISPLIKRRRTVRKPEDDAKYEPEEIERAVSEAITGCKYTEDERKERLRVAVLDALFKRRTMKSSSQYHGVPFTTLQTYFHRSKQILANEAQQLSLLESLQEQTNNFFNEEPSLQPGSRINDVLYRLTANAEGIPNDSSTSSESLRLTGSNKRKPKTVHRFVDTETEETRNDSGEAVGIQEMPQQPSLHQLLANIHLPFSASLDFNNLTTENDSAEVLLASNEPHNEALNCIASLDGLSEEVKQQLRDAMLIELFAKATDETETPETGLEENDSDFDAFDNASGEKGDEGSIAESSTESRKSDRDYIFGLPLDSSDTDRIDAIRKGVEEICAPSMYTGEQKQKLLNAVLMVVSGELTINAASNMMQLPSSTVHPYVHRARSSLGTLLPPQATGPTFWNAMKTQEKNISSAYSDAGQKMANGSMVFEELDRFVTDLVKSSLYDSSGKQRLKNAVIKVLTSTISTAEAGKKLGIPASTVQPYVNKARKTIEERGIGHILKHDLDQTMILLSIASEEEVKDAVKNVIENGGTHSEARREQLFTAVCNAVSGKMTIKEACHQVDLAPSTAHPYVSKARHLLGTRCPDRKGVVPPDPVNTTPICDAAILKQKPVKLEEHVGADNYLPQSVRGVSRMLCDTKFDILATNYKASKETLKIRIGEIIQGYSFKGNRDTMCDAIAEVILEGRTLADVCASHSLAQTTLSTYVRLVKVHIKKEIEDDREGNDITKEKTIRDLMKETKASNGSAKLLKQRDFDFDVSQLDNLTVKREPSSDSGAVEDKEGSSEAEEVDSMLLHSQEVRDSQERCMKLIIAYLLKLQYRRSQDAQEKMRICLEDVLLDGLAVNETLGIHKGPSEHVLQVYLVRVRDVYECINTHYPVFLAEIEKVVKKTDFSRSAQDEPKKANGMRSTRRSSAATIISPPTTRRGTKRAFKNEGEEMVGPSDSVSHLNCLLTDVVLKPLTTYVGKLDAVNFALEIALIVGLAKLVYDEIPAQYHCAISETNWTEWGSAWKKKHLEFKNW